MRRIMSQTGMNYIQMLLVLVLAGILGALVVPYLTSQEKMELSELSRERATRLVDAEFTYYRTHGEFTMEIDSLKTVLRDPDAYVDPLNDQGFQIGVANQGQDFSISSNSDPSILIVTEDRWEELQQARLAWRDYQEEIRLQARGGDR
ncbi:Tfp pilus assembly protein FimT/FimU [Gemmatimonadota bacterium]